MTPFRYYVRVRYAECDAQKVVFNTRYAEYVDVGLNEFLRAAGVHAQFVTGPLDFQLVKQTVEWKAPKTRFASKITPQKTFSDGKAKCRETTVESDAHDRFQRGLYTFCKGDKGDWQFKLPSKTKAK